MMTPIDMVLHCPNCHLQHVDEAPYDTIEHRSHLCGGCGFIWRPADVATNGVLAVKTRGKHDSSIGGPKLPVRHTDRAERLKFYGCST